MRLIARLRRGGSVLALLAAVLLVGPMIDCATFGGGGHEHSSHGSTTELLISSVIHDSSHPVVDDGVDRCGLHLVHCIVKSVLPGGTGNLAVLHLLLRALAVAAVVVLAVVPVLSGSVRGPPVAAVPVFGGRVILTRFCIARR